MSTLAGASDRRLSIPWIPAFACPVKEEEEERYKPFSLDGSFQGLGVGLADKEELLK